LNGFGSRKNGVTLVVRDVRIDVMNNEASINLRGFDAQKRYVS